MDLLGGRPVSVASYGVSAAYAGWLLRQYGAEVLHTSALDPEGLGSFLAEGATFEPKPPLVTPQGTMLITDAPVTPANRATLEAIAGGSRVIWITPWGLDTPWETRPATDLAIVAAGGWMFAVGDPDREPIGPPGSQPSFVAGLYATIEALGGEQGSGLSVVSRIEATAATSIYDAVAFQYLGLLRGRAGNRFASTQPTLVTLPCRDGYLGIHAALYHQWVGLCHAIGHPEMLEDERLSDPLQRMQNTDLLDSYLVPWLAERGRWEAYHELQAARIPCAPIPSAEEVLGSPQLAAREAFRTVVSPSGRSLRVPGPPARVAAVAPSPRSGGPGGGPWRPGALRVVDLSNGWAGPLVSTVLACYGADVIKVESFRHFDWWRGSRPPGDDPEFELAERSHVFNTVNRGKRGLALDLANPAGNAMVRRLLATADVVIENFTAGVCEKLGLGYESLAAENPGLIMLRQPGHGSTGPEASYVAFGNTIEAMSGLSSVVGYEGGRPYQLSNALGDPVSGLNGAVAVLAAVEGRQCDGRGRCIEAAQLEGFLPFTSEELIACQLTGVVPGRRGNARVGAAMAGVFAVSGEDTWVALEADRPSLARFAETAGIAADASAVTQWLSTRERDEAVTALAAAGIAAAPVNHAADLLLAEPLGGTGFWVGEERDVVGFHLYPSHPVVDGGTRRDAGCPAPRLDQHTGEILTGLGCTSSDIADFRVAGGTGRPATVAVAG